MTAVTFGRSEEVLAAFAWFAEPDELELLLKAVPYDTLQAASNYMPHVFRDYQCSDVRRWIMRHRLGIATLQDALAVFSPRIHAHELDRIPVEVIMAAVVFVIDHFDRPDISRDRFTELLRAHFKPHLQALEAGSNSAQADLAPAAFPSAA